MKVNFCDADVFEFMAQREHLETLNRHLIMCVSENDYINVNKCLVFGKRNKNENKGEKFMCKVKKRKE